MYFRIYAFYRIILSVAYSPRSFKPGRTCHNRGFCPRGGQQKGHRGVRNIRGIADCTGPNGKYTTEYTQLPDRLIFRQVRAGNVYTGHTNGGVFWTKDEKTGDFSPAGTSEAFAWRSHDYQMLVMDPAARFRDAVFEAEETFAGSAANRLRATDELGKPAFLFFDKTSNLMLGFTIQNPFGTKPETILTVFNEWKQAGKTQASLKGDRDRQTRRFRSRFTGISLNKIDEKVFSVPLKVAAMNELLVLHSQARAAHFNRDPELLVSDFADDYTFIGAARYKARREASIAASGAILITDIPRVGRHHTAGYQGIGRCDDGLCDRA